MKLSRLANLRFINLQLQLIMKKPDIFFQTNPNLYLTEKAFKKSVRE